jgi:hypothetical protein
MGRLTNDFLLKDRRASADQMPFVPTFPWRTFVLAKGDGHRANKNEVAILVLSVTTKDFPHAMLPCGLKIGLDSVQQAKSWYASDNMKAIDTHHEEHTKGRATRRRLAMATTLSDGTLTSLETPEAFCWCLATDCWHFEQRQTC